MKPVKTFVRLLKEAFPGCAVTTDVITGFPRPQWLKNASKLRWLPRKLRS